MADFDHEIGLTLEEAKAPFETLRAAMASQQPAEYDGDNLGTFRFSVNPLHR